MVRERESHLSHLNKDLKVGRKRANTCLGEESEAEGRLSSKSLGQEEAWYVHETVKRPLCLQLSMQQEKWYQMSSER